MCKKFKQFSFILFLPLCLSLCLLLWGVPMKYGVSEVPTTAQVDVNESKKEKKDKKSSKKAKKKSKKKSKLKSKDKKVKKEKKAKKAKKKSSKSQKVVNKVTLLIEEGEQLLAKSDLISFFKLLNENKNAYPQVEKTLTEAFVTREKELFFYFLQNKLYEESLFHLENIKAIRHYGKYVLHRYDQIAILNKMKKNGNTNKIPSNGWIGMILNNSDGILQYQYAFPGSILSFTDIPQDRKIIEINHQPIQYVSEIENILSKLQAGNIVMLSLAKIKASKKEKEKNKHIENYYTMISHKPPSPLSALSRNDELTRIQALYLYFDVFLKTKPYRKIKIKRQKINLYKIKTIRTSSPLYKKGVRRDDAIGIISTEIRQSEYKLKVIHFPNKKEIPRSKMKDYTYSITKDLNFYTVL